MRELGIEAAFRADVSFAGVENHDRCVKIFSEFKVLFSEEDVIQPSDRFHLNVMIAIVVLSDNEIYALVVVGDQHRRSC